MLLAEVEVRHTRPVSPTRRVALGERLYLPTEPAPGFGGLLLAGVVAAFSCRLDEEEVDGLLGLLGDLEHGRPLVQPRLRHRFQRDVVGLDRSHHRLFGEGEELRFDLQDKAHPLPQVLAASYAAGMLSRRARPAVFRMLRRATMWAGEPGPALVSYLTGDGAAPRFPTVAVDRRWARVVLGFAPDDEPGRSEVLRRYRDEVRLAHPDAGGDPDLAGEQIARLAEARRILLGAG